MDQRTEASAFPLAVAEMKIALEVAETNGPIHRAEGREEQADLCLRRAAHLRGAIGVLEQKGPLTAAALHVEGDDFTLQALTSEGEKALRTLTGRCVEVTVAELTAAGQATD